MPSEEPLADRLWTTALVLIGAITYALVVAAITTGVAVVVGTATGGGLVRAKFVLFLAGFLLLAYATVRLWPTSPSDLESGTTGVAGDPTGRSVPAVPDETRFQTFVQAVPPLRWLPSPPPERRVTPAGKLFLGSVFVLLVSYLLETAFGIA